MFPFPCFVWEYTDHWHKQRFQDSEMKIVIIGNSGSGKTWLTKQLSNILTLPHVHLDDFFWEPGGFVKKRSHEEVDLLIQESKDRASWIAEGVFGELAAHYLDIANLLIWLDIEWPVCKKRLEKRDAETRKRLGGEPSQEGLSEFLEWAFHYYDRQDMRSYKGHKTLFQEFPGKKAHLRFETAVNQFVAKVQQGNVPEFRPAVFRETQ